MPQVHPPPAPIAFHLKLPASAVGVRRFVWVPSPSWPEPFAPQQNAAESAVMPHVCDAPLATAVNLKPLATAAGVKRRGIVVLLPSCPKLLSPQQYGVPSFARAQLCWPPGATCTHAMLLGRRVGESALFVAPVVSTRALIPQQKSDRSVPVPQ